MLGKGAPGCNIINHWNLYYFWMDHKKHYQTIANSLAACLQLRVKDFPKPVGNIPSSTHLAWDCYWITYEKHLTHWGRVTYIYVGELTIIGSDNGLSHGRHQAIIRINAGILLIEPLGTNFSEILIGIQRFSFTKMRVKMSSAKWRPFCHGLNVLIISPQISQTGANFPLALECCTLC